MSILQGSERGCFGCFFLYDDGSESTIVEPYTWEDILKHFKNGGEFGVERNIFKGMRG